MSHLKALLKKNWILFKRSKCLSCCEILIPIFLVFILVAIRKLVTIDDEPETSYFINATMIYDNPVMPPIPSMGEFIKFGPSHDLDDETIDGALAYYYAYNHIKNCADPTVGGLIALSPQNQITEAIASKFAMFPMNLSALYFQNTHDMDEYIGNVQYGGDQQHPRFCLGVVFDNSGLNGQYSYGLRFNSSNNNAEVYNTISQTPITKPFVKEDFSDANLFINSGFLTVQNWIDNIILEIETKSNQTTIKPMVTSLKTPAYKKDNIAIYLQGQTNVFLVLPLILPYVIMIYRIVYEKEKKIREGMKMMGMTDLSFYLSWCISYLVIYTILCLINASILTAAVFTHSNWFFIFLYLWIFCIVLIFQSFFVSVFFTRAKYAIVGGIVFFYLLYMINTIIATTSDVTFQVKEEASLSSHAAMAFAAETILFLETNQLGLNANTMNTMVNNYKLQTYFAFEFLDLIIFVVLSLYLDQVFPNEFGRKKHPLFFLNWIWKPKKQKKTHKIEEPLIRDKNQEDLEIQQDHRESFEESVDATLKQQEVDDQALLIKNLVKVYDTGKRAIDNLSLKMYQNQIFVLLGHNGAGKTTTISILTGLINATSGGAKIFGLDINEDMEELRKKMGVCPQHDILFDTLTVEEHLYLFATFKGTDPKEIPAEVDKMVKAVDLQAKRFDMSKNLSGGQKRRLSVAIAFIGNSKLILLDEPTSGMDTSARRYIWEMLKDYKNDRIVILTTHFMDEADFLGDRIAIMGDGMLKCVGSSVYLKNKFGVGYNLIIVKKSSDENPELEKLVFSKIASAKCISRVAAELSFQLPLKELPNFKDLFLALDENIEELGIASYGISITTLEEVFLKVAEGTDVSHSKFQRRQSLDKVDDFELDKVKIKNKFMLFFVHFWALMLKRLHYFKRDKKGLVCEIILPCIVIVLGLCLTFITFTYPSPAMDLVPSILTLPIQTPVQMDKSFYQSENFPGNNYHTFIEWNGSDQNNLTAFDDFAFNQRNVDDAGLYGAYFIPNIQSSTNDYTYYAFYNSTTPASVPIFVNQMNQAIIRNLTSRPISITCTNYPFPLTASQKSVTGTATGFIASFIFAVALAFIPSGIVVFIVKEREQGVKHQQLVSGVGLFAYWMANYAADLIKIVIPIVFAGIMCLAFGITSLTEPSSSYAAVWILLILYGTSVISFAYLVSFLFKQYGNAQAFTFVFTFLISAIGSLIIFIFRLIPSTRSGAKVAQFFLRIFAPFSFGFGILNVANRVTYALIEGYYTPKSAFDTDIAAWDMIFMGIETVVYMLLVFMIEKLITIPKILKLFSRENSIPYEKIPYDEDVEEEFQKIATTGPKDYAVYVKDLRKVFMLDKGKKKVAVSRISLGINNGECFGLLGVNGAGKTTTFKMLCGEIPPTSGTAYISGYEITTQLDLARENIGYCPQFDALLENLTAKEHLYLYAAIKGIPHKMREQLVEKQLQEMNLKKYENICAGTYSGGNKRKLSVAIAMLGNPPIVFLDEPSTGMDPEARRFMWNVINRISTLRKRSSIILTTHSMEEAEALSTRISIMVNGNLKCLGSVQHIKSKFGQGYEIEIKTVLPEPHQIDEMLVKIKRKRGDRIFTNDLQGILQTLEKPQYMDQFQPGKSAANLTVELTKNTGLAIEILMEHVVVETYGAHIMHFLKNELGSFILLEHFQSFYRIKLNVDVSVGKLFGSFEEFKKKLNIAQYSIKQATIEQIFNMFAKEQDNELAEFQNVVSEGNPSPPQLRNSVLEEFEGEAGKSLLKPYEIKDN